MNVCKNMYVCMYVCMHVCVYSCMYVCMYVFMFTLMHLDTILSEHYGKHLNNNCEFAHGDALASTFNLHNDCWPFLEVTMGQHNCKVTQVHLIVVDLDLPVWFIRKQC